MTDEIQITINVESAHEHSWPHYSIGTVAEMPRFQSYLSTPVQDDSLNNKFTKLVKDQIQWHILV